MRTPIGVMQAGVILFTIGAIWLLIHLFARLLDPIRF